MSFSDQQNLSDIDHIKPQLAALDAEIQKAAPEWPIDKIAKIDLAILRLSSFELLIERNAPPKVIIDEAIELAKEFGNVNSSKFVNGVLGTLLKAITPEPAPPPQSL